VWNVAAIMPIPLVDSNRRSQLAGFAMRFTHSSGALFYAVSFPNALEGPQVFLEHSKNLALDAIMFISDFGICACVRIDVFSRDC